MLTGGGVAHPANKKKTRGGRSDPERKKKRSKDFFLPTRCEIDYMVRELQGKYFWRFWGVLDNPGSCPPSTVQNQFSPRPGELGERISGSGGGWLHPEQHPGGWVAVADGGEGVNLREEAHRKAAGGLGTRKRTRFGGPYRHGRSQVDAMCKMDRNASKREHEQALMLTREKKEEKQMA